MASSVSELLYGDFSRQRHTKDAQVAAVLRRIRARLNDIVPLLEADFQELEEILPDFDRTEISEQAGADLFDAERTIRETAQKGLAAYYASFVSTHEPNDPSGRVYRVPAE